MFTHCCCQTTLKRSPDHSQDRAHRCTPSAMWGPACTFYRDRENEEARGSSPPSESGLFPQVVPARRASPEVNMLLNSGNNTSLLLSNPRGGFCPLQELITFNVPSVAFLLRDPYSFLLFQFLLLEVRREFLFS